MKKLITIKIKEEQYLKLEKLAKKESRSNKNYLEVLIDSMYEKLLNE